jgi:hypothetical protein
VLGRDRTKLTLPRGSARSLLRLDARGLERKDGRVSSVLEAQNRPIEGACHCGVVRWSFQGVIESVTACNCTVCRRYGALWAYDFEGERIVVSGATTAYVRGDASLGFHFCAKCGCVAYWRSLQPREDGRRRIAVNVRLSEPEAVASLPIDHFEGLVTFEDLPRDGRCVVDMWF